MSDIKPTKNDVSTGGGDDQHLLGSSLDETAILDALEASDDLLADFLDFDADDDSPDENIAQEVAVLSEDMFGKVSGIEKIFEEEGDGLVHDEETLALMKSPLIDVEDVQFGGDVFGNLPSEDAQAIPSGLSAAVARDDKDGDNRGAADAEKEVVELVERYSVETLGSSQHRLFGRRHSMPSSMPHLDKTSSSQALPWPPLLEPEDVPKVVERGSLVTNSQRSKAFRRASIGPGSRPQDNSIMTYLGNQISEKPSNQNLALASPAIQPLDLSFEPTPLSPSYLKPLRFSSEQQFVSTSQLTDRLDANNTEQEKLMTTSFNSAACTTSNIFCPQSQPTTPCNELDSFGDRSDRRKRQLHEFREKPQSKAVSPQPGPSQRRFGRRHSMPTSLPQFDTMTCSRPATPPPSAESEEIIVIDLEISSPTPKRRMPPRRAMSIGPGAGQFDSSAEKEEMFRGHNHTVTPEASDLEEQHHEDGFKTACSEVLTRKGSDVSSGPHQNLFAMAARAPAMTFNEGIPRRWQARRSSMPTMSSFNPPFQFGETVLTKEDLVEGSAVLDVGEWESSNSCEAQAVMGGIVIVRASVAAQREYMLLQKQRFEAAFENQEQFSESVNQMQFGHSQSVADTDQSSSIKQTQTQTQTQTQQALDPHVMMQRLEKLMEQSAKTQAALQDWDKRRGLPKSHSPSMVHSSRSRRQLQEGVILKKWDGSPLIDFDQDKESGTGSVGNANRKKMMRRMSAPAGFTASTSMMVRHHSSDDY